MLFNATLICEKYVDLLLDLKYLNLKIKNS